ncbi:scm-like with four MBT domains protein 1 isoform X1 [Dinothrombium tinctorium]|uniref:Scm-like with four MBT domains protein 1 isoform X1 n=1 Tax=Dinothrombium tinctorium TaxID=1965070 RepID=A0A443RRW8_9ACAR|nr:scm-like with four MBT domains protein 1 isoform X1 [Dinothrombium tinctorium]
MSAADDDSLDYEIAVREDAFWHIEASHSNGFEVGMKLEIEHSDHKYWIANVTAVFGQLLSLKWEAANDTFWFDVKNKKCYPYGHFRHQKQYQMQPPQNVNLSEKCRVDIKTKYLDSSSENLALSKPQCLFNLGGVSPVELFAAGTVVEVSHSIDPEKHWFAEIVRNVGGRLYLKWICRETNHKSSQQSFWLFFAHPRVHHLGFAKEQGNISYEPPYLYESWASDIQQFLFAEETDESILRKYLLNLAKSKRPNLFEPMCFSNVKPNDKVSMIDSKTLCLMPATVKNRVANNHLLICPRTKDASYCYPNDDTLAVLPFFWGTDFPNLGINFQLDGDQIGNNDRNTYLHKLGGRAAPLQLAECKISDFTVNSKLEVVHSTEPDKICEGKVVRVTSPLIWVQISSDTVRVLPYNSTEMFPCGWTKNNEYPLTDLQSSSLRSKQPENITEKKVTKDERITMHSSVPCTLIPNGSKAWCPPIYFNHKCFTGPALSKSKICELPRSVGPGPVQLVIQEVISKIISVAYVPSRVLNELSSKAFDELLKKNNIKKTISVEFKAKYQKRCYRDQITVIRSSEQVEEYCRTVCSHLKCCYNLFGTQLYDGDECPSNCRGLTKSNKVLKRAIYYREKAAEAKLNQEGENKVRKMTLIPSSSDNENSQNQLLCSEKKQSDESQASDSEENGKKKRKVENSESKDNQITAESKVQNEDLLNLEKVETKKENIESRNIEKPIKKSPASECSSKESTNGEVNAEEKDRNKTLVTKPKKSKEFKCEEETIESFDNPLHWSVKDVYNVIKQSHCSMFANTLLEHEIDGAALLLLDNETIRTNLLTGYTRRYSAQEVIKLSTLIQRLKSKWFRNVGKMQCLR